MSLCDGGADECIFIVAERGRPTQLDNDRSGMVFSGLGQEHSC